jgi:hypothetical protein
MVRVKRSIFASSEVSAVDGVDFLVCDVDADAAQRNVLPACVEAKGHRGACPKGDGKEVVRRRPGVEAAHFRGLIRKEPVSACAHHVLESPLPGFHDAHVAVDVVLLGRVRRHVA